MASIYDLKSRFQALLRPAVNGLQKLGVRPNHLTLLALLGSAGVGCGVLLATRDARCLFLLPLWLFARMALNAMDGMLARDHGMITPLGGAFNEVGDVLADLALYLPLAFFDDEAATALVAFSFAAVISEFCGLIGPSLGASRRYEGPMGKSDRAFLVGLAGLLAPLAPKTVQYWPWVFWAAAALGLLCGFNRIRAALRELRQEKVA
jgi:CDP-diacylglycerol---glycerol-3-phosphate 3-phosphatidyltransferase